MVYKHAKVILPDVVIMENVEEIQQRGSLDSDGHLVLKRKGGDYKKFITAMKSLGYVFDSRELVARIGNSVMPVMAQKLVETNCGYLKVGERMPNMRIDGSGQQLRFA